MNTTLVCECAQIINEYFVGGGLEASTTIKWQSLTTIDLYEFVTEYRDKNGIVELRGRITELSIAIVHEFEALRDKLSTEGVDIYDRMQENDLDCYDYELIPATVGLMFELTGGHLFGATALEKASVALEQLLGA